MFAIKCYTLSGEQLATTIATARGFDATLAASTVAAFHARYEAYH